MAFSLVLFSRFQHNLHQVAAVVAQGLKGLARLVPRVFGADQCLHIALAACQDVNDLLKVRAVSVAAAENVQFLFQ